MILSRFGVGMLVLAALGLTVTGCDMLAPKVKKTPVKVVPAVTPPVVAAAPVVRTDEPLAAGVLAKVGDWTLTQDEFNKRLDAVKNVIPDFDANNMEAKKQVLDELVRQKILVHEARAAQLDKKPELIAAVQDFEDSLLFQEIIVQMTKEVVTTEEQAKEYYNTNGDMFLKPMERKLSEIVVPTETEAKDIAIKILQGADFAQTARELSKGKTAAKGGDLGFLGMPDAPYDPLVQKEAEALKKGEVSRVFQAAAGYTIVKLDDLRGGDKVSFDEVKEQLIAWMTTQKQQELVLKKISEIEQKTDIKRNYDLLSK